MDTNKAKKPIFTYVLIALIVLLILGYIILKTQKDKAAQAEPSQEDITLMDDDVDTTQEDDIIPADEITPPTPGTPVRPTPGTSAPTPQPTPKVDPKEEQFRIIKDIVSRHKGQLESKYRNVAAHQQSGGEVKITIYANPGKLASVEATPTSGNLNPEFMETIKANIRTWDFGKVKDKTVYTFNMSFK